MVSMENAEKLTKAYTSILLFNVIGLSIPSIFRSIALRWLGFTYKLPFEVKPKQTIQYKNNFRFLSFCSKVLQEHIF
jgi:hypothetical protein